MIKSSFYGLLNLKCRISTGKSDALMPYVKTTKNGAQIEPSRLINPEQRKLANGFRIVNDTISIQSKTVKVCLILCLIISFELYEEISKHFLTQNSGPVMGTFFAYMKAAHSANHSYSDFSPPSPSASHQFFPVQFTNEGISGQEGECRI